MSEDKEELINEAHLLHKHYTGKEIPNDLAEEYIRGVHTLQLSLSPKEFAILCAMKKNAGMLVIYDFGIARYMPTSNLRRRLLLINSIIECQPEYVNFFLNSKKIKMGLVKLILLTLKSGFIWMFSFLLFTLKGWK